MNDRVWTISNLTERLRQANPLPEGAIPVGVGLLINGGATYLAFGVASRTLGDSEYAAISVLWALMFAIGNGAMQPLEQEVARAVSARRADGIGAAPLIKRASLIGVGFTLVLIVVAAALYVGSPQFADLFDSNVLLFGAFCVGLGGFAIGHLTRGTLSSHGRFRAYGEFFAADGVVRPIGVVALAAMGVMAAGPYGAVLVVAPYLGAAVALRGQRGLLEPGPEAPWSELSTKLGWLLLASMAMSLLINGGVVAVDLLATDAQAAAAGVFINGLFVARIPLFLFQAVLAALLPKLSRQAAQGEWDRFTSVVIRLMVAIAVLGAAATAVSAVIGPALVRAFSGSDEVLGGRDLALLALSAVLFMAATALSQALLALNGHARVAMGWLSGFVVFVAVTMVGSDLFLRVETGLLVGSAVIVVWHGYFTVTGVRHHRAAHIVDLAEAAAEIPLR